MKRVVILGIPGAGKSTLARRLGRQLKLPVHHLDRYFWKPGWKASDEDSWRETLAALLAQDNWILDGNYQGTIPLRLQRADTAIHLNVPRRTAMKRVATRVFTYWNEERPDMADGCPERWFDRDFMRYVWGYHRNVQPQVLRHLREFESLPGRHVYYLEGSRDAEDWLRTMPREIN